MKNYHSSVMISSAFWLCYACLIYRSLRLAHSISLFGRRNNALGSLAEYEWTHPILKFTQLALEEESALIIQYSKLSHPVMLLHIIVLLAGDLIITGWMLEAWVHIWTNSGFYLKEHKHMEYPVFMTNIPFVYNQIIQK